MTRAPVQLPVDGADESLLQFLYLMPIGVAEFSDDGTITMLNPMAVQQLQLLHDQGRCTNLFAALRSPVPDLATRIAEQGARVGLLLDRLQFGTLNTRVHSLSVVRVDAGRLMAVLEDVTARAAAEERFRVLLDAQVDPYFLIDDRGVVDCNQAAIDASGMGSRAALLALSPEVIAPCMAHEGKVWLAQGQCALVDPSHVRCRIDWSFTRPNGTQLPVDVDVIPVRLHEKPAVLAIWHDLTQHKLRESEILRARDEARAANEAKSEFLARMSHELRTPLNAIIGFTRIVMVRATELGERHRSLLERVAANGEILLRLINDILDLSRIEAGRMTLAPTHVDLVALVRETVARLDGYARSPNVAVQIEHPRGHCPIFTDEGKLVQVLTNLVGNALKFTEQGHVTVRVAAGESTGSVTIAVADSGIGIPPERLRAIFDPFEQAERTTTRRYGGTGLGLAISRSLCEQMGYSLSVASTPGQGSTFTIHIPDGQHMNSVAAT